MSRWCFRSFWVEVPGDEAQIDTNFSSSIPSRKVVQSAQPIFSQIYRHPNSGGWGDDVARVDSVAFEDVA